jgi:tetratricopeptide (TPR) repeat protein
MDFDPPMVTSLVRESEAAARQAGNSWNLAYALLVSMAVIGDARWDERLALACGQESLALFRATGDPWKSHWTQTILACLIIRLRDKELGRAYLDESGRFFRQFESIRGKVFYTHCLGTSSYFLEDFHQMVDCFQETLQGYRELGIRGFSINCLRYLGTAYKRLEEYDRSAAYFWECISSVQAVDDPKILYMALAGMGGVAAAIGQPPHAVHLLGAAERSFEGSKMYGEDIFLKEFERDIALAHGQLAEAAFAAAWTEGREMSLEEAVREARQIFESVASQVPKT